MRAGALYPNTTFIVSGGGQISSNVVPLIFRLEEGRILAGMAAASTTESGIIGMVGALAIPPVQGTFRAFEAGARSVRPDVEILESFTGDWDDVAAAKEAAVAQLSRGADVPHPQPRRGFVRDFPGSARSGGRGPHCLGTRHEQ